MTLQHLDGWMPLIVEQPSAHYGSAILVIKNIVMMSAEKICKNYIEILTTEVGKYTVTLWYKPLRRDLIFNSSQKLYIPTDKIRSRIF